MVNIRKDLLTTGQCYHIFSRSIAKYVVFNSEIEYARMLELINILRYVGFNYKMSEFKALKIENQIDILNRLFLSNKTYVDIVAYCIMPTHFHLILKQNIDDGITKYMAKILNSYSKYFNVKHQRKGPLWTGKFKNVLVDKDEQLLHLTRYIHLNPTSAKLVSRVEDWQYSSYNEYVKNSKQSMCNYKDLMSVEPNDYKKFVYDRKNYQRDLSLIKSILIDDYAG